MSEAISQLESLRENSRGFAEHHPDEDGDVWRADVRALNIAIDVMYQWVGPVVYE
jgi:hypothetical protein